ncbi:hypothetical protein M422DRAFT_64021 [Sphaerobolus stellatus SS14]|nr:hypothetical protein M422DRAFT_64021 [Sphaerobolus stellatus SS14]
MLSNDLYALIGFACESTVWGAYTILFIAALVVLFNRRHSRAVNPIVLFFTCILYGACTTHFAIEFNHFYTTLQSTGVTGYANENQPLWVADLFISLTDFLGDLFLLWRCWLVWGGNYYVLILPFLTSVGGLACLTEVLHLLLGINPSAPVPPSSLVPLGLAGYILPLCTNVMITGLIAGRIYWVTRGVSGLAGITDTKPTRKAISILVESGALYLLVQFIFVILFGIQHPSEAIVGVTAVQIYGIAPTLIIIRVGLGQTFDQTSKSAHTTSISWAKPTSYGGSTAGNTTRAATESRQKYGDDLELANRKSYEFTTNSEHTTYTLTGIAGEV